MFRKFTIILTTTRTKKTEVINQHLVGPVVKNDQIFIEFSMEYFMTNGSINFTPKLILSLYVNDY